MSKRKNDQENNKLLPADDFLILELDDRLEFGAVLIEDDSFSNTACNSTGCTQNGSC